MVKKFIFYFAFLFAFVVSLSFGIAQSACSTSGTGLLNEDVNYFYNISVDYTNCGVFLTNIIQVNITLPSGFSFIKKTNGTDAIGNFTNTSSVLIWTNISYLINAPDTRYFWFNATASNPGEYNITVSASNGTDSYSLDLLSVSINHTEKPKISFLTPGLTGSGNYSRTSIPVNLSLSDFNIDVLEIYLYNSSVLINNTNVVFSGNTSASYFINFTNLTEGAYYLNVSANDSNGNRNYSSTLSIILDKTVPSINNIVEKDKTSSGITINWTTNEDADSKVLYGKSNLSSEKHDHSYVRGHSITLTSLSSSTEYDYKIESCDRAGNCVNSSTGDFTTDSSSSDDDSDSGSGSGSGDDSGDDDGWIVSYYSSLGQLNQGYKKDFSEKYRVNFKIGNDSHYVGILDVKSSSVDLIVSSTPQEKTLNIGNEWKVDLNPADSINVYEISIKLNSINNSKASITVKTINENYSPIIPSSNILNLNLNSNNSNSTNQLIENSTGNIEKTITNTVTNIWFWIGFIVVLAAVGTGIVVLINTKRKNKKPHFGFH